MRARLIDGFTDEGALEAARRLRAGDLVALPTETVYGLGANALDRHAVARIFEAKARPSFDPLIVHVGNLEKVSEVAELPTNGVARELASAFWPGPLTLILRRKPIVPDLVTSGLDTVAVRIPGASLARRVLNEAGVPIAAPSANRFGSISPTTAQHVLDGLGNDIDAVLDGGPCAVGVESTIIDVSGQAPTVLRYGGLALETIEARVGSVKQGVRILERPMAPGQLARHYAPKTPLRLLEKGCTFPAQERALVVVAGRAPEQARGYGVTSELSPEGNLVEAATRLFAEMRRLDGLGMAGIDVIGCREEGLGRAILDRLRRAAA